VGWNFAPEINYGMKKVERKNEREEELKVEWMNVEFIIMWSASALQEQLKLKVDWLLDFLDKNIGREQFWREKCGLMIIPVKEKFFSFTDLYWDGGFSWILDKGKGGGDGSLRMGGSSEFKNKKVQF
jgi:hypothetical protein